MAGVNFVKPQNPRYPRILKRRSTINGFENFLVEYGAKYGYNTLSLLEAGKMWNKFTDSKQKKYANNRKARNVNNDELVDPNECDMKMRRKVVTTRAKSTCPTPNPVSMPRKRKEEGCAPKQRKSRCAPLKSRCAPKKSRCAPTKKRCAPTKKRCAPKMKRCAPKMKRCAPRRKNVPRRRCAPKRRPRCGKYKCSKPGPITNNGYLNFIRYYRRKHCGLAPNTLVRRAARAWCRLPAVKKDRYRRQAFKASTKARETCKPC